MKAKSKLTAIAAITAAIFLTVPTAAHASTTDEAPTVQTPNETASEIAGIADSSAREKLSALLDKRVSEGAQSSKLIVSGFAPASGSEVVAARAAQPTDCTLSVLLTSSPGRVSNDMVTSCTSTVWQRNDLHIRITGANPFNPFDTKVLADEETFAGGPALSATASTFFGCNNTNETLMNGYGSSTITVNGAAYESSAYDDLRLSCGW